MRSSTLSRAPDRLRVPVGPLQEAFKASGLSASEVAKRLGWCRIRKRYRRPSLETVGDSTRFKRAIGLIPQRNGRGVNLVVELVDYDRALEIAEALDVDPIDLGL